MSNKKPNYIEFTPENLKAMRLSTNHSRLYYREKGFHPFGVARWGENEWTYYCLFTPAELAGASAAGIRVPRNAEPVGSDQDVARAEVRRLKSIYHPLRLKKKKGQHGTFYIASNPENHLKIFFDSEKGKKVKKADPSYEPLMSVLMDAFSQAAHGKGRDRHGDGLDFMCQDLVTITDAVGHGGPMFQAIKKLLEGSRLDYKKAREEYLGSIVYIAGMVAWMDSKNRR